MRNIRDIRRQHRLASTAFLVFSMLSPIIVLAIVWKFQNADPGMRHAIAAFAIASLVLVYVATFRSLRLARRRAQSRFLGGKSLSSQQDALNTLFDIICTASWLSLGFLLAGSRLLSLIWGDFSSSVYLPTLFMITALIGTILWFSATAITTATASKQKDAIRLTWRGAMLATSFGSVSSCFLWSCSTNSPDWMQLALEGLELISLFCLVRFILPVYTKYREARTRHL